MRAVADPNFITEYAVTVKEITQDLFLPSKMPLNKDYAPVAASVLTRWKLKLMRIKWIQENSLLSEYTAKSAIFL